MSLLRLAATAALLAPLPLLAQYAAGREVQFSVRVENVSTPKTLKLSNGTTAPAPTAPLLWTVTDRGNPLFTPGKADRGQGLEQLAEDGNPGVLADYVTANLKSVVHSGVVTVPVGDRTAGPILPGKKSYQIKVPAGEAYSRVENPKGELGYYVVADGSGSAYRYHVRSPSFINLTALEQMCLGHTVADVVGILGSIDIVLGETDR